MNFFLIITKIGRYTVSMVKHTMCKVIATKEKKKITTTNTIYKPNGLIPPFRVV